MNLLVFIHLFLITYGFHASPLVVSSHKLVKGLKTFLPEPISRHDVEDVTNMLKHLITECSSDEYVILDIPGLRYDDLNDKKRENWPFLSKYLSIASSDVGLPFVNGVIDLNFIKDYIVHNCDAELLTANVEDENSINYIDTRTKVIYMKFNDLNEEDKFIRTDQIFKIDEFVRRIIRKLPSPHYSIILTSSKTSEITPIPMDMMRSEPGTYGVFNSIIYDARRNNEVELNSNYKVAEPLWIDRPNPLTKYLLEKEKSLVKFLDYDLWMKNEKLIMTMILMILTIMMIKMKKLFDSFAPSRKEKLP
ncbi:protein Big1p [[Candida] jaroonii]|uniref:Protein Big1p n=1 Tax=[Candida] jaroonii TaxID=467808 RepID=A0ACA9Y6M0_9ASCO|nr:protein Big1p [[Candida] jaroonii]